LEIDSKKNCEYTKFYCGKWVLNKGYDLNKIDLSHCFTDTKAIPAKRGGNIGYDGYKKVKGVKLGVLVDL
jgi:hypothetical protein